MTQDLSYKQKRLLIMNKKILVKALFILLATAIVIVGMSYGSSLLFFKLHNMDLTLVRPFTIWQYWSIYKDNPDKYIRISVNLCAFTPYVILAILPIIVILSKKQRSLHGDARFATLNEVRQAGLIDPKDGLDKTILVGKFQNKYLTYGGFQFVMLAAPTRSGKGVGVVIPNCLNYSDSLVVLDIKLENFDITSGFRAKHGQEVYLFCPFDEKGRTHRYNPLEYISSDPAQRIGDIDAIGTALYSGGNDNDKFWSENAKDLFRGLCLMVLEHPELPKTLGEILRQASGKGKPFKEHVQTMLAEAQDEDRPFSSACVDALNRIINNSENTLAGIVSTFNGPLLIFQNPRVDLATSANDFDLRDVRRKKMTIYLGVTPDKLKDAAVIVNLFFDQLLNLNTRVLPQQDKSLKYQCLMILDEFTAIGKVAMIQQSISYQAGYNMRALTIIQNKSQLEDKYGKSGAITLMANHALMVMYAPSPVVQADANEYSEMLGYQTVKSKNKSRSFASTIGGQGSRSESESDQRRALMLPQELKELGRWREIVSLENCKPILCDKIKYFEDPVFMQRTNWETPDIPIQDVNTFVAKIENRCRDMTLEDLNDPDIINKVVGADTLPDLPLGLTESELNAVVDEAEQEATVDQFADDVANTFEEKIFKEPIDLDKYRMSADEAADASSNIFGSADKDEEDAFEIEDSCNAETISSDKQESLDAIASFGFSEIAADESDEKASISSKEEELSDVNEISESQLQEIENEDKAHEEIEEKIESLVGTLTLEEDNETRPQDEQEEKKEAQTEISTDSVQSEPAIQDSVPVLAAFGVLDTEDEMSELSDTEKDVLAAYGIDVSTDKQNDY